MDDDLIAAIRGVPAAKTPRMDPTDAMIRTVQFEASPDGPPEERRAIAAVIANRAKASGKDYTDIVQEPGQFEPWASRRKDIDAFTPDNPRYAQIKAEIAPILAGQDPTGGATQFYAPDAQAKLGRPKPSFDDGTGVDIGATRFFHGAPQEADPDLLAAIRGQQPLGTRPVDKPTEGSTTVAGANKVQTKAQEVAWAKLQPTLDYNQPLGSVQHPYNQVAEDDVPDGKGAYYVDLKGQLQRTPGGEVDQNDVKTALAAGDWKKAQKLSIALRDAEGSAFTNHALSAALLGGKNEAGAVLTHPLDFITGGGIDAPSIQATIHKSDAADAVQRANHPFLSNLGSVVGGVTGGGALSMLTGGGADLPLFARLGFATAEGAGVGGAQGYLSADGTNAQRIPSMKEGAKFGAMLGPGGELAGDAGRIAGNKLLGLAVDPETAALAKAAKDTHGIDLRGGQIANSHFVKFMDSVLNRTPGTGYAAKSGEQLTQFTRAVAKTFGEDADGLTPQVMSAARKRIGNEFDRIGAATTIKDPDTVLTDLGAVVKGAQDVLSDDEVKPLLKQVEQIASAIHVDPQSGERSLSGESYLALTRRDTALDRLTKSANPNVRHYADQMKTALLDAVQRNASADDVKALKLAKTQWARMKTVEPLAEKAGPNGEISPALVMQAMRSNYDNLAYDGGGPLGELGKIGQRFLKEPPSSGTAERMFAQKLLGTAGVAAGGGGALWLAQHPEEAGKLGLGAAALGVGTLAAGKLGATLLDNPAYRRLLLRSAKPATAVVGKTPLLNAPKLLSAPGAAMLSNRLVPTQTNQ